MSITSIPLTVDGARNILSYSRESNERILGIFGQDQEIIDWAEANGYTIVAFFRDLKVHGQTQVTKREAFPKALQAIKKGKAEGIVVSRLDRLARSFEVQDDAMRRVWNAGGKVFSCDYGEWEPDKPGSNQWRLRRDYARAAEDELHAICARLENSRREKIKRGGYGGGFRLQRRYGDELIEIRGTLDWYPIPAEQAVIRRVCEACANGKGYTRMARILNAEGVPTVTGVPWTAKTVRGLALRGPRKMTIIDASSERPAPVQWISKRTA
jgi:DNA invertase Pin-like site-specific DNA recombinase